LIGEDAARLIGSCILAELWAAIQRRAALPQSQRPVASVMVDEAQDFLRLPVALGDAVAQSRGLGVGWTVSHQNLGQLPADLRAAVLANLRSKVVLQTTADDARTFAREFAPHLEAADLQGLGPFEAFAAVSTGAAVAPPCSIRTRPPLEPLGHGDEVRARSRQRYGCRLADVDAEIQARLSRAAPEAPVGAKRRR
jgi:DNA helicase HerA-like ATPase